MAYTSDQWNPHLNFDYRNTHVEKRTKIKYCWLSRFAVWMSFLWWIPESLHYSFCPGNKAAKNLYDTLTINPSVIHSSHSNHSIQGQDVFKVMILIWWRELAVLPYSPCPFFKWIVANEERFVLGCILGCFSYIYYAISSGRSLKTSECKSRITISNNTINVHI